jgi:hypothetical protein
MPSLTTMQIIGDWDKQVQVPLRDALHAYVDATGRSGEKTCRDTIVAMARALASPRGNLTKTARAKRPIKGGQGRNRHFMQLTQARHEGNGIKWYAWMWGAKMSNRLHWPSFDYARSITNAGMARRSWMWSLRKYGAKSVGKPMAGASRAYTFKRGDVAGYVKQNRVNYIMKAMNPSWGSAKREAERKGTKLMLKRAKDFVEKRQQRAILRREKRQARQLQSYFKF